MRVNGNHGLYMVYIWTIMIYIWFIMVYIWIPMIYIWTIMVYMCVYIYWLVVSTHPSEKYDFVSWDDDIPNMMGKRIYKILWFQSPPEHTEES